jgi:hypothetical protein
VVGGKGEDVVRVAKRGVSALPGEGDREEAEEMEAVARREDWHRNNRLKAAGAGDDAGGERRNVGRVREDEVQVERAEGGFGGDKQRVEQGGVEELEGEGARREGLNGFG